MEYVLINVARFKLALQKTINHSCPNPGLIQKINLLLCGASEGFMKALIFILIQLSEMQGAGSVK